jgi:thiol:disulfide interchange protein
MAILTNNFMKKILIWLSGKKTTIATVISALIIFLIGRGLIAQDVAELISAIMIALGLTANIATNKIYNK